MFERRNIQRTYLKISREVKDFLLSDKSREFFIFLFFFFVAGGFWLLQTLNNDYEADFSIPVRLKGVPNNVVITSEPASELRIKVKDKGTVLLNYMLGKSFYPVILDYADYKGVDNQVRIYPAECLYPPAFHEAGYIGVHLFDGSLQTGAGEAARHAECRT